MREKPKNITINRGSTTTGPVSALWRILPPPGLSGSPGPGGGRYRPVKTATLSELPSTPDTFVCTEESIGDMPLSPSGCGVDDNLTANGHNKVDARSRWCSYLLALSAQFCCVLNPSQFFGEWAASGKKRGYRCGAAARSVAIDGVVATADDESRSSITSGGIWQQYDHSAK